MAFASLCLVSCSICIECVESPSFLFVSLWRFSVRHSPFDVFIARTTSGISSYGDDSPLGAIELRDVSTVSGNQGIHRCTLPESDPATNPSTISLYVGIYNPGQGECALHIL